MLTENEKKKYTSNLRQIIMDICYKKNIKREDLAKSYGFTPRNFQRFDKTNDNKFLNSLSFLKSLAEITHLSLTDFMTMIIGANEKFDPIRELDKSLDKEEKNYLEKIILENKIAILKCMIKKIGLLNENNIDEFKLHLEKFIGPDGNR